jgi:hypothetical protein
MLIPILAYRIQELAFGGLKESTLKRRCELAEDHANGKKSVIQPMIRPKVGTRYVREYGGKLHEVTVLESGYEYNGQRYHSLTEIAKVITGTKWSGPVFFGYKRPTKTANVSQLGFVAPSILANPPRRAWSNPSTHSTPNARPARPTSKVSSTRAGRLSQRNSMMVAFLAATWNDLHSSN